MWRRSGGGRRTSSGGVRIPGLPTFFLTALFPDSCLVFREEACPPFACLLVPHLLQGGVPPSVVAAMQAFSFLRKGSPAEKLRTVWKDDTPLKMAEGGAMATLSSVGIIALKHSFHLGNSHQTLVCLSQISMDVSTACLVLQ